MLRAWPHKPSGLSSTQTEFRFLFVTSTTRNAASTNIADYNAFVQGRAATGLPASFEVLPGAVELLGAPA